MFDVGDEAIAAQTALAASVVDAGFQETFNLTKGSIPANTSTPRENFDACAKRSMEDLAEATAADRLFGSLAHGHGQPASVQRAYLDVITQHFNSDMSSADAQAALIDAVAAAQ